MFLTLLLGVISGVVFMLKDGNTTQPSAPPLESAVSTATAEPQLVPISVAAAPTRAPLPEYTLFVPTIGVYAPIVELPPEETTWNVTALGAASVGHLMGTSPLQTGGNSVVVGHVEMPDGRGGVFKTLHDLKVGDPVVVRIMDREQWYRVREFRNVAPDDLSVLYPTPHDQLTLITCDEYDFIAGVYRTRFVVIADSVT